MWIARSFPPKLVSEREGVDDGTPTGHLVTQMPVSVAEMERFLIAERTRSGLAVAREKSRLIGRSPVIPKEIFAEGKKLVKNGKSIRKAAKEVGISHTHLSYSLKITLL